MVLTLKKGRMIAAAAACFAAFLVCVVILVGMPGLFRGDILMSALRGALIGGGVASALLGSVFAYHALRDSGPVVTIDDRGIEFHRDDVGLVPWESVEKATVEPVMGSKRLCVYVRPPAPKPRYMTKLLYGIVAQKRGDLVRLMIPFGRFGADEAAVRATLDARGAQA